MNVVFIGLGTMGLPMAINLVRAGHDAARFARRSHRAARGQRILENARPRSTVIDMSTVAPGLAIEVAQAAAVRGITALDAPVSGGEAGAVDGALSIMVGGEADVFERRRQLLEAMGTTVVHVGGPGAGQTVKAANQLLVAATIRAVAEALTFLDASAVDLEPAVTVLAGGLAGNRILDRKSALMLARDFRPGFRVELHHKDLGILIDAARHARVPLPVGALVSQLMESAVAHGDGALDHSALLRGVEQLAGRER